jgi:hypothetical protein
MDEIQLLADQKVEELIAKFEEWMLGERAGRRNNGEEIYTEERTNTPVRSEEPRNNAIRTSIG